MEILSFVVLVDVDLNSIILFQVSSVHLVPIERMIIILFDSYPRLGKGGMFMYEKGLTHFIRVLAQNSGVFKGCLSQIGEVSFGNLTYLLLFNWYVLSTDNRLSDSLFVHSSLPHVICRRAFIITVPVLMMLSQRFDYRYLNLINSSTSNSRDICLISPYIIK